MALPVPVDELLTGLSRAAGLTIRAAQQGDYAAMGQIAQPQNYEAPTHPLADGHTVFVALDTTDNDRVSGFLWFLRSTWDGAGFFVRLVMTHPDKQRRGVGSLLMAHAAMAMHTSEADMPISLVVKTDNAAAIGWYTKLDIAHQAQFPADLPEDESEVEGNEEAQYQFRINASSQAVQLKALRILKLSVQGTLLANPDRLPRRSLRFRRQDQADLFFRFWCQSNIHAFNDNNENVTAILTGFTEHTWTLQGQREISCILYRFVNV